MSADETSPSAAQVWSVQTVGTIVDECCNDAGLDPCSELFIKHEVDGDVLQRIIDGPAEDLLRLAEGPSEGCKSAKTMQKFGARSKLHAALRARNLEDEMSFLSRGVILTLEKTEIAARLKRLSGTTATFALLDESLRVVRKRGEHDEPVGFDRGGVGSSLFDAAKDGVLDVVDLGRLKCQVIVPVHMTLLVKRLTQDNDDNYSLEGTLVQRPLLYDLSKLPRANGDQTAPYFKMRVNDGRCADDKCMTRRKIVQVAETMHGARWLQTSTTFDTNLPLKLTSVFSAHPFHIMAAEVMIELTSFAHRRAGTGDDTHRITYELRPSLLCNVRDVRSLVSVRDYDKKEKIDEMTKWDILGTNPTVEFEINGNGKPDARPFCTPKMRLTFYLYRDPRQAFLETLMPIFFALFANILSIWKVNDFTDHLSNTIAIGLTVVFIIPSLSAQEGYIETVQLNWLYIMLIFLALIVSALVPLAVKSQRYNAKVVATFLSVVSLVVPCLNLFIYMKLKNMIRVRAANPCTFNGREGRNTHTAFVDLQQFFETSTDPEEGHPTLEKARGLIHDDIKQFLDVYYEEYYQPWRQEGKRFVCGPTRLDIVKEAETYTNWFGDA